MEPVYFSVTSSEDPQNPLRFVLGQKDEPLKVGRNKKSSIVVTQTGISWVHLEIRPSQKGDENAEPSLCVRDVSSNGVGLRRSRKGELQRLEKDVDTELPPGASLEMPFRVKAVEGQSEDTLRTVLHLSIDGVDSPSSELTESEPEEQVEKTPLTEDQQSRDADKALQSEPMFDPEAKPEVEGQRKRKAKGGTTNDRERPAKERKSKHSFTPGQFVKVVGLKGAKASLNGSTGLLVEWDAGHSAWKVRMEDGSGKAFRPSNLELHQIKAPTLPLPGLVKEPGASQAAAQSGSGTGSVPSALPPPPPEGGPAPGSQPAAPGPPGPPGNRPQQRPQAVTATAATGMMPGLPHMPTLLPMPPPILPMPMLPGMMSMPGMPLGMPLLPGLMGGLTNPFTMPTLPPRMPLPTRPARPS
eukprot:TRINITY_DN80140_c0_g1_i1.p1 TRINITY_DN80140_c0_g1~~TRINITY_DN80140_c0_g1_i1.p1  ORF type:complete len:413 (-),score=84.81 TRINITY_DN80140_c0_g1_i1:5-1243(-)